MKKNYFMLKDKTYFYQFTKEEIYQQIDSTKPETFIPFLKMMDYPYIKDEWNKLVPDYDSDEVFFKTEGQKQLNYMDYYYGY